ncbi:MAG TPA: hypothetical protein VHN98_05475 [Acidimicrobiales bacterium]|nr:hypothetical protein [Acidimicrobiales bacterium]
MDHETNNTSDDTSTLLRRGEQLLRESWELLRSLDSSRGDDQDERTTDER